MNQSLYLNDTEQNHGVTRIFELMTIKSIKSLHTPESLYKLVVRMVYIWHVLQLNSPLSSVGIKNTLLDMETDQSKRLEIEERTRQDIGNLQALGVITSNVIDNAVVYSVLIPMIR